jgi:hypothetical protein
MIERPTPVPLLSRYRCYRGCEVTDKQSALAALAEAQNRLTRALLIEPRNVTEIIELADVARRAERRLVAIERVGR